ncbi:MAG TPA: septum formation initiator family protein [Dehalococcoidia bacterium]|nr:septum formation initiator family protein [Dehalococcoidia bacterium]
MVIRLPNLTPTRLVLLGTAIAVTYFLVTGALTTIRSQQLNHQEASLQAQIQTLQERYNGLQAIRDYLNSDEYIEKVAREQLGLVKDGESGIIAVPEDSSAADGVPPTPSRLWWEDILR